MMKLSTKCMCVVYWTFQVLLNSASAYFVSQTTADYYVFILERSGDAWKPIIECEAMGATFGYHIAYGYSIDGCSMMSSPPDGCRNVKPPPRPNATGQITCTNSFAVISRGNCTFARKAYEVQTEGFEAAIIYNDKGQSPVPMGGDKKYDDLIRIPAFMVTYECMEALITRYPYSQGYATMIRTPPAYDLIRYLIPFLAVVGFCFFMLVVALVIKLVRDRRREARRRLSRRNLRKIPTRKYKKGEEPDTCAICLDEFEEGDKLRVLPCKHVYHTKCVDPWLTKNRKVCPVCKRKVAGGDSSDSDSDHNPPGRQSERAPLINNSNNNPTLTVGNSTFYSAMAPRVAGQYVDRPSSPEEENEPGTSRRNRDPVVAGFTQSPSQSDSNSLAGSEEGLIPPSAKPKRKGHDNPSFVPDDAPKRRRHPAAKTGITDTRLDMDSDTDQSDKQLDIPEPKSHGNKRKQKRRRPKHTPKFTASAPASLVVGSDGEGEEDDDDHGEDDTIHPMDPDNPKAPIV